MTSNLNERPIPGCKVMSKENFWSLVDEVKTACSQDQEVLYVLALSGFAKEPGFVAKLAGCFADDQTDEQLIAEVNAAFATDLDPEDFSAIMNYANHQLVEVAKSQLGNVGGEPYWSWYGFSGCIRPLTGEKPSELQERVRAERQMEVDNSESVPEENSQEEPDHDNGMCMG